MKDEMTKATELEKSICLAFMRVPYVRAEIPVKSVSVLMWFVRGANMRILGVHKI